VGAVATVTAPVTTGPLLVLPGDVDHETWLAARRKCIGASDVAAILGISPWQGPLHIWLDKMGQLNWDGNAATKWGTRFEDDVLDEFIANHPELIVTPKPGMFACPVEPWRTVSLDAEALSEEHGLEVVEIKTGQERRQSEGAWGEPGTDQIPPYFLTQVTWACDIRQASHWRLAFLPLDELEDYREYEGDFSPALAEQLRDQVRAWRETHIVGGVEPAADGLTDTFDILTDRRKVRELATEGEIPREALLWQAGYIANHNAINEFTDVKAEYGALLRQALLAAGVEIGTVDGQTVTTWKRSKAGKPTFKVIGV
jgi:putative phage-type endonuclease